MLEQRFYREPLLRVLAAAGGSMSRSDALRALDAFLGETLTDEDRQPLEGRGAEEGWQNRTSWEVKDLKNEGLLEPTSTAGTGTWKLSSSGTAKADELSLKRVGVEYVALAPPASRKPTAPFEVDPNKVDRATRAHQSVQDSLADVVRSQGLEPLSPFSGVPAYDLAWMDGNRLAVAEVKSISDENEERQLRLGLGQVLRYRFDLQRKFREKEAIIAYLAIERPPSDESWISLSKELGVRLVWPPFPPNAVAL